MCVCHGSTSLLQNQEVMTAGALRDKGSNEELTQKVAELQEQVKSGFVCMIIKSIL